MRTCLKVVVVCLLMLFVFPSFSLAKDSEEPTAISADSRRLLLDGWEMVLPDIEGQYKKNMSMTVFKYTLKNGKVIRLAMKPPPIPPIRWNERRTDRLEPSPPGYPKDYTQKLIDWWVNGGRGNFLNKNGTWVPKNDAAIASGPPPVPEFIPPPQETPPTYTPPRAPQKQHNVGAVDSKGARMAKIAGQMKAMLDAAGPPGSDELKKVMGSEAYQKLYKEYNRVGNE